MARRMRCIKVSLIASPAGSAADRRITIEPSATLVTIDNLAIGSGLDYVVYYRFGESDVDCAGISNAHGCVGYNTKETEIPVPSGPVYTHLSLRAGATFNVLVEHGVTTP